MSRVINTGFGLSKPHSSENGIPKSAYTMGGDTTNTVGYVSNPKDAIDPLANFNQIGFMPTQNMDPFMNTLRPTHVGNEFLRDIAVDLGTVVQIIYDQDWDLINNEVGAKVSVFASNIQWQNVYFPVSELDAVPELTSGRFDTFTKTRESTSMRSFGKTIQIEHDAWQTPEGRAIFAQQLLNLALSTRLTQAKDIVSTLLSCKIIPRAPNVIREQFMNKNMKTIMRREIMLWDCLKQDARGLQTVFNVVDQDCKERGIKLDMCLGSASIKNVMLMHTSNLSYETAGPPGVVRQNSLASDLLKTPFGYKFVPINQMCTKQNGYDTDILKSYVQIGEFFVSQDLSRNLEFEQYSSLNRAISIYDEDEDKFETVTINQMIQNCNKFDLDGCPLTHLNIDRRPSLNEYTSAQKNADPFLFAIEPKNDESHYANVKYFGQIESRHFRPERVVQLAHTAKNAALKNLPNMGKELKELIYQVKDIIRQTDEMVVSAKKGDRDDISIWLDLVAKEYTSKVSSENSHNTNPTVANLMEGQTVDPTPLPYLLQPEADNPIELYAWPFLPGYQNWSGFLTVHYMYTRDFEICNNVYRTAIKNFEIVSRFVVLFSDYVNILQEQWEDCIFLNERLCASYHLNPTAQHTAFENLVAPGQLPAFIFPSPKQWTELVANAIKFELFKDLFDFNHVIYAKLQTLNGDGFDELKNNYESYLTTLYSAFNLTDVQYTSLVEGTDLASVNSIDVNLVTQNRKKYTLQAAYALGLYLSNSLKGNKKNSRNDDHFIEALNNFTNSPFQNVMSHLMTFGYANENTNAELETNCVQNSVTLPGSFKNAFRDRMNDVEKRLDRNNTTKNEVVELSEGYRIDFVISRALAKSIFQYKKLSKVLPADPRCLDREITYYDENIFESFEERQMSSVCHMNHLPIEADLLLAAQNKLKSKQESTPNFEQEEEFFGQIVPPRKRRRVDPNNPNQQLSEVVATIQLDGFKSLWHSVNQLSRDPLVNMMAKIYLGSKVNLQQLLYMADHNIVVPFKFVCARVGTYRQAKMIFVKSKGGSVIMVENPTLRKIEIGHDAQNRVSNASYYFPFKAIVPDANMVYLLSNTFTSSYEGGMGTKFIQPDQYQPRNNNYGQPGSLFCFLTSYEQKIQTPLSLTGIMRADDQRISPSDILDNRNEMLSYSTAHFYNCLYEFPSGDTLGESMDGFSNDDRVEHNSACNVCCRGLTLYYNQKSGGFDFICDGAGHWKNLATYPGAAATRGGQCTEYDKDYWARRQLTNVTEIV